MGVDKRGGKKGWVEGQGGRRENETREMINEGKILVT